MPTPQVDAVNESLAGLVKRGCSPAEALDYYMVEIGPYTQTEWAEQRSVTPQTVSENVAKAKLKLAE